MYERGVSSIQTTLKFPKDFPLYFPYQHQWKNKIGLYDSKTKNLSIVDDSVVEKLGRYVQVKQILYVYDELEKTWLSCTNIGNPG